ncbi:MAG TPA: DNA polymerase sliding clamp [Methanoregulaceae archaeon]|nr:DNA polymerase sliding clamp [Methanoregulaceae archaeon]
MLKATIDANILKESIDAISALVTECRLHSDENGMSTRAVDTANVAMISLSLKKEAFESYSSTKNELGMDIAKMKNIFGMMGRDDLITLELPEDGHKLQVSFEGYRYSITLLDPNTIRKDPNPPNIDLPGKVVLSGSDLNNAIKAASVVSDKIALGIDPEKEVFFMSADGDTDNIRREFGKDEVNYINGVEARSLYSLDYLKDMGKVMNRAEEVELSLGIDHPAKFSFYIASGNGFVEYLLAPRIEAD